VRELLERAAAELAGASAEDTMMDVRFEVLLARLAGNPVLGRTQQLVHRLWVAGWAEAGLSPGDRREFHAEHLAILAALEAGDSEGAVRRMHEHVDRPVPGTPPAEDDRREDRHG
jgi:DNA-binding GntR family transcriptional regulator